MFLLLVMLLILPGSWPTMSIHFHYLNVSKSRAGTTIGKEPSQVVVGGQRKSLVGGRERRLKVIARGAIYKSNFSGQGQQFSERIRRDQKRVIYLTHRLMHLDEVVYGQVYDFGSEVISGIDQGSGEYFVRVGLGSPPRKQYMVLDTGSDMVWVQCQPCTECYRQSDPVFDPTGSHSFTGVSCSSTVCGRLDNTGCQAGRCHYAVSYGDGSYTKGTLALETITFGRTVVHNVAIGCGHRNHGLFAGAAGLLGLGGGSMSFIGQLGGQLGNVFSYCLDSRGLNSFGWLVFGRRSMPIGATWIPILRNPRTPSFYYLGLEGLGVGGIPLPISSDVFQMSDMGDGGVIMDTGTAITRFPRPAYEALRDAFVSVTGNLPRAGRTSILDTCYDLSGYELVQLPTVSFYFSGGPILILPARNILIEVDEAGIFCLAFCASESGISIIGNIQQEGIQISFDGANGFVGFGPEIC